MTKFGLPLTILSLALAVSCAPVIVPRETPPDRRAEPTDPQPVGREREKVREGRRVEPVVLGVIVSESGDPFLERSGRHVVDGIRLAVDEHNKNSAVPVELVVLDDAGVPERAALLVRELEARSAIAVLGPLRPEGVAAVAAARSDSLLLLLSPTAPELPAGSHLYSLNTVDARGAVVMADYALRRGVRRVGLLYPESYEYRSQATAFRDRLVEGGGQIVSDQSYMPGTTTFADAMKALAAARPDAIYIPAPERDIRQIAPQISYYGVSGRGTMILGGEGWSGDGVLAGVAPNFLEGVVATAALYRESPEFGWTDFVSVYEESYRRSLENALPALGYDAAGLILRTLESGLATADLVARRFADGTEYRGATGLLSVRDRILGRRPILVRIEKGNLVPISEEASNDE